MTTHLAAVQALLKLKSSPHDAVAGYPFDAKLLAASPLYRASRARYLKGGGTFLPVLVSAGRTLSSPILLENVIEYSPLERELVWAATDRFEREHPERLESLSRFASSLFHEQNHRILWWQLLPPAPRGPRQKAERRRFLNFAESLVITADMALADELGEKPAVPFRKLGLIYDPGTDMRRVARSRREYRNSLQACLHATYLNLELFEPKVIARVITALYSSTLDASLVKRATARAANLNRGFITRTNLAWQRANDALVAKTLGRKGQPGLVLDDHPLNNIEQYKLGELWFDLIGL